MISMSNDDETQEVVKVEPAERVSRTLQELRRTQAEELFPVSWTEDQITMANKLVAQTNTAAGVMSSIPMRCKGIDCSYANSCPLIKHKMSPAGNPCPLELNMIITMFESICAELGVNPDDSYIDAALIRDLCNVYIQETRANKILADEHFIMDNILSIDNQGNPMYRKEPHVAIFYTTKLHTRKLQILNALIATREARIKATRKAADSVSLVGQAELMHAMGGLLSDLNQTTAMERRKEYAYDIDTAEFKEDDEED